MKLSQKILTGVLGIIAVPSIVMGGSITLSLVQGKTVEEAVQILAGQIDALIGRVEIVEERQQLMQTQLEQLEKERACNEYNRTAAEIKDKCGYSPYPGIDACIRYRGYLHSLYTNPTSDMVGEYNTVNYWQEQAGEQLQKVNELKALKTQYLGTAQECGISLEEESQLSEIKIAEYICLYLNQDCESLPSNPPWLEERLKREEEETKFREFREMKRAEIESQFPSFSADDIISLLWELENTTDEEMRAQIERKLEGMEKMQLMEKELIEKGL